MQHNKPSSTALFVANGMYYNIHQKRLQGDIPEEVKYFNTKLVEHYYGINGNLSKRFRLLKIALIQFFSIRGFFLHFLIRKKCIETHVREFIRQGYEQVIVLGAGYDTLSTRLATNYPHINFIELDHPATAGYKKEIFTELGWNKTNISYISHNLMSDVNPYIHNDINTKLKTVFICEGVLMYLQKNNVEAILSTAKNCFVNDCRFVFTFMEQVSASDYMFKNATTFVRWWLRIKKELFTWGIPADNIGDFLNQCGWQLNAIYNHKKLKSNYLSLHNQHLPVATGEDVVICSK